MSLVDESGRFKSDDQLNELFGADRDKRTITYCGGGIAATTNACVARLLGFTDVAVFDGSMTEWMANGKPVNKG